MISESKAKPNFESKIANLEKSLESRFSAQVSLSYRETSNSMKIDGIFVPKGERGEGIGSQVMEAIVDFADQYGLITVLTPSTDFGATSVNRLRKFYSQFGFTRNFGGKKDFRFIETMIRRPKAAKTKAAIDDWKKEGYTIKHVKKPPIREDFEHYEIQAFDRGGKKVGYAAIMVPIQYEGDPDYEDIFADSVGVDEEHQRKGLASAMYMYAEKLLGKKMHPGNVQEEAGKKLWNQPNRSFGKVTKILNKGYNSYGDQWTPLKKIKQLETEDRDNEWFDDSKLDINKTLAIWVTEDPRDSAMYNLGGSAKDALDRFGENLPIKMPNYLKNDIEQEDWDTIHDILKNPLDYCTTVDLKGAVPVIEHDEYFKKAYLYIKPQNKT